MNFEDLVGAIRAADGEDPELAAATQLRLRRSLEGRARGRHQLAGIATAVAILFAGTVSWALATGHVSALWAPAPLPREVPREATPPAPTQAPVRQRRAERAPTEALATVPRPAPPETVAPPVPAPAPVTPRPSPTPPAPVEVLYRKAHDLHFHGGDPSLALAAWDAYLAAEPDGRFSVEARYNRAIALVRLARYAEARAALSPFARGEIDGGYRQTEAGQLVERLARYE